MIEQIKNWHYKAGEEDFFSKFMFEYLAFIAYVHRYRYSYENLNDRGSIQKLKQDNVIKDKYLEQIDNNDELKQSRNIVIEELNRRPLGDNSRSNEIVENRWWGIFTTEQQQSEATTTNGKISGLQDWCDMIEFWYSIRNNLFHGGKDANDERDKLLVKGAYKTLRPLVDVFIEIG